ncbi:hypothetical protein EDC01DRAFT_764906 [Geopyxis carbonaria]|nr:hypothetical protein EDC01DRAFT_764906 [Geopyxis carbonaria]
MKLSFLLSSLFGFGQSVYAVFNDNLQAEYDFIKSRCRLGAHQSAIVGGTLMIDGGSAIFELENGSRIQDLNPYILGIDVSKPFSTSELPIIIQEQKPHWVAVVNRGAVSGYDNYILISGGHFYNKTGWDKSQYTLSKSEIPPYTIYKFSLDSKKWENVSFVEEEGSEVHRTFGGASATIPSLKKSYYLGGVITPRSASDAPDNFFRPTKGMIVYDHDTKSIVNETNVFSENDSMGYWHGTLEPFIIGEGKGFMIALMSEAAKANSLIADDPDESDEFGTVDISFNEIKIYNLDTQQWSTQKTWAASGVEPVLRTRFCSALIRSEATRTWEYYIYGGQLRRDNQTQGVDDIYVLTIPSFIWTKISVPGFPGASVQDTWTRSHTCHAIGGQLLIVGGWPPGSRLESNVKCQKDLVSIFNLNNPGWLGEFDPKNEYKTPETVQRSAEFSIRKGQIKPAFGTRFADPALEAALIHNLTRTVEPLGPEPPGPSPWPGSSKARGGFIAGMIVLFLLILLGMYLLYRRWKRSKSSSAAHMNGPAVQDGNLNREESTVKREESNVNSEETPVAEIGDSRPKEQKSLETGTVTPQQDDRILDSGEAMR